MVVHIPPACFAMGLGSSISHLARYDFRSGQKSFLVLLISFTPPMQQFRSNSPHVRTTYRRNWTTIYQTSPLVVLLATWATRARFVGTGSQHEVIDIHRTEAKKTLCPGLDRCIRWTYRTPLPRPLKIFGGTHHDTSKSVLDLKAEYRQGREHHIDNTALAVEMVQWLIEIFQSPIFGDG